MNARLTDSSIFRLIRRAGRPIGGRTVGLAPERQIEADDRVIVRRSHHHDDHRRPFLGRPVGLQPFLHATDRTP